MSNRCEYEDNQSDDDKARQMIRDAIEKVPCEQRIKNEFLSVAEVNARRKELKRVGQS